jgi:zinc protease
MRRAAVLASAAVAALGCAVPWLAPKPVWEQPPPPAKDAPVVEPGALHRTTLANGLHVLVLEDHRLPRVGLGVSVRRGAGAESPERAGLAAFTAELMKRGAGDRDALALARAVDEIGGSLAVETGWDSTNVAVSGLSGDLDRLLDVLADVVRRPRFEAREALAARAEQLAGLEQAKDDPGTLVGWHAQRAVYGSHRYALPQEGTRETVARLDAAAARAFYRGIFTPSNAIFYAFGDVDAEALLERVRAAFGDWSGDPPLAPATPPPDPAPPARFVQVVDQPDLEQARIVLMHEGIARDDDRRIAVDLMNDVLGGGGFSSRLMASVRGEEGLTYGVASAFAMRRQRGPFVVSTFTRVSETGRAVDLLLAGLEGMRSDPPTAEELADAKSLSTGSFGLSLETSGAVMAGLVGLDVYGLPEDSLDTYRARVRAVTREQVAALARELLHPDRIAIVVLGPAAALAPQLEHLGPVAVVKP